MRVHRSSNPRKKYVAIFDDGSRVHFGGKGCMDYTLYYAKEGRVVADSKRRLYLKRHRARENWEDPKSPGALSRWLLWEEPTLANALKKFKKRFGFITGR